MVAALLLPSDPLPFSFMPGVPRYLLPVLNRPILLRNLDLCLKYGIQTVYLPITSQEHPQFADLVKEYAQVQLIDLVQSPPNNNQTFLVMPRELVTDCDLLAFLQSHDQAGAFISVASVNGQIHAVSPGYLQSFLQSPNQSTAHVVETFDIQTMIYSAEQYLMVHRILLGSEAKVHETAVIAPDAFIAPQSHIGANCYIGSGAVIDEHCCLGANCWVGADAYLHNSVCLSGVRVGIQATVENAVIAPGTLIGRTAQIQGSAVLHPGSCIGAGTSLNQAESVLLKGLL